MRLEGDADGGEGLALYSVMESAVMLGVLAVWPRVLLSSWAWV